MADIPRIYIYSFENTQVTFYHPAMGYYQAYGTGIGSLALQYTNDISFHDVAADLAVVVSKSAKMNGTATFEILQSSDLNLFMNKYINYVRTAPPDQWATATLEISCMATGETWHCYGVSPKKIADANYQSQSQNRTWALMVAHMVVESTSVTNTLDTKPYENKLFNEKLKPIR